MRMFIMLAILVVAVLFVAGAIHIQQGANNTLEISVDKQKAEQTAETLVREGEQVLGQAEQAAEHNASAQPAPAQSHGSFFNR
jgi:Tfp pilus assembly protein PilX